MLTLADYEPGLLVPAQDFHHGEQRPGYAMQYYWRSAFSQPDDGPQPGKVTECHSGQVDMETGAVPGNTAQRLYQSGIGFLVDVATQDERVMDLAVIGDLDLAGQRNHQPLPVLGHGWRRRGWLGCGGPHVRGQGKRLHVRDPSHRYPPSAVAQWHYKVRLPTETCQYQREKNFVCIFS
jgi:hypothetical protein